MQVSSFIIIGFKCPYRHDVSGNSCRILFYVRDGLLSKSLFLVGTQPDIQVVPAEISDRKQKLLVLPIYRPPQQISGYFAEEMSKLIDIYSRYENRDFDFEPGEHALSSIIHDQDLYNMIKKQHASSLQIDGCIDLIFTNRKQSLMHSKFFKTGLNDHHHII